MDMHQGPAKDLQTAAGPTCFVLSMSATRKMCVRRILLPRIVAISRSHSQLVRHLPTMDRIFQLMFSDLSSLDPSKTDQKEWKSKEREVLR